MRELNPSKTLDAWAYNVYNAKECNVNFENGSITKDGLYAFICYQCQTGNWCGKCF